MKILRIIITKEGYESRKTLFYILVGRGIDDEMKKRDNVYKRKKLAFCFCRKHFFVFVSFIMMICMSLCAKII